MFSHFFERSRKPIAARTVSGLAPWQSVLMALSKVYRIAIAAVFRLAQLQMGHFGRRP